MQSNVILPVIKCNNTCNRCDKTSMQTKLIIHMDEYDQLTELLRKQCCLNYERIVIIFRHKYSSIDQFEFDLQFKIIYSLILL